MLLCPEEMEQGLPPVADSGVAGWVVIGRVPNPVVTASAQVAVRRYPIRGVHPVTT